MRPRRPRRPGRPGRRPSRRPPYPPPQAGEGREGAHLRVTEQRRFMSTKVLIVDIHAELYRDRLRAEFPALQFALFHAASEVTGNLSDIDVMIMFGIEVRGRHAQARDAVEMDPIAGDRRRSFPALSVAQARRADHQRARHSRPGDARTGRLSDDGGEPRRGAPGRGQEGAFLGAAVVEHSAWQDRGDRRRRYRRHRDRRAAQGVRHARRRGHAHAAQGRRFR